MRAQQLGDPEDPTTTAGQVAVEPERPGELGAERCGVVRPALLDAALKGSGPQVEGLLVVSGQVGRGGEPVEVVEGELIERGGRTTCATRLPIDPTRMRPERSRVGPS